MLTTEFLLTSFVVVLVPGTGVLYTISTGLFSGWRSSIAAATGCTAGIIPHLLACILGLSALMHLGSLAFQLLKYAGAAYLLYLAWTLWRDKGAFDIAETGKKLSLRQVAGKGFLINILNPKLSIFFLAFLPQFISTDATPPTVQLFILSATFMAMTLIVFVAYGCLAHQVSAKLTGSMRRMRKIQQAFAAVFAFLGVKLALAEV